MSGRLGRLGRVTGRLAVAGMALLTLSGCYTGQVLKDAGHFDGRMLDARGVYVADDGSVTLIAAVQTPAEQQFALQVTGAQLAAAQAEAREQRRGGRPRIRLGELPAPNNARVIARGGCIGVSDLRAGVERVAGPGQWVALEDKASRKYPRIRLPDGSGETAVFTFELSPGTWPREPMEETLAIATRLPLALAADAGITLMVAVLVPLVVLAAAF